MKTLTPRKQVSALQPTSSVHPKTDAQGVGSQAVNTDLQSAAEGQAPDSIPLPVLRPELDLLPVHFDSKGTPGWTLHDPVRGRFFKLGWIEFELLKRWQTAGQGELLLSVNRETTLTATQVHLDNLIAMLEDNELLFVDNIEGIKRLVSHKQAGERSWWKRMFSITMFYRQRLVNPDRLLTRIDALLQPLLAYRQLFLFVWAAVALLAVAGMSAHWFELRDTFSQFMTPQGFVLFGLVLIFINILHEFGHGLMAKHYGCRVTEMGIALIFMLPVAYCDTSDAWRLQSARQRLLINAGGILMEMLLATVACAVWLIMPDGVVRTLAFFVAVSSLVTTLFINLSPFLKFDGYYLLADYLRIENLQLKAFNNLRWQLRKWFLGGQETMPYQVDERTRKVMNLYAASTWVYRFILYLSISWMVYQFWFKALGTVLMLAVFSSMVLKPVVRECISYFSHIRKAGFCSNSTITATVLLFFIVTMIVPLPRKVVAPAVYSSAEASRLFAPHASYIESVLVMEGDEVLAGQLLVKLVNPELEFQKDKLQLELEDLQFRMARENSWKDENPLEQVSAFEINSKTAQLREINKQLEMFDLHARDNSTVVRLPLWVKAGLWVNTNAVLAELVSLSAPEVRAYVPAEKLEHLKGSSAFFYSDTGKELVPLAVLSRSSDSLSVLADPLLSVPGGGSIAVSENADKELLPVKSWHLSVLQPQPGSDKNISERRGVVMFPAKATSLAASASNRLYGALIRESGF